MTDRRIFFGPPGTGKTTRLIRELQGVLAGGVDPGRVGFVSFSRRAIAEAKERAREVTDHSLPHFRTIHSTAYHLLGLDRGDVLQHEHLRAFGAVIGMPFKATDQPLWEGTPGDRSLALAALAAARGTSLEVEWRRAAPDDLPWALVARTVGLYERYKTRSSLWDFNDMIARAEGTLDLDVLFVDEAQDTSRAQWDLLRRCASHVPLVFFAGDDDQAVYQWNGADPEQLLRFRGDRAVLPVSYRLPRAVKEVADRVAGRIHRRVAKTFAPRDADGHVTWARDLDQIDLHGEGTWLLLARSNYQLLQLRQLARQQGVVYSLANGSWSWTLPAVTAATTYERLRKGHEVSRAAARAVVAALPGHVTLPPGDLLRWEDLGAHVRRDQTWMAALSEMPLKDREYVRALRRSGESLSAPGRVRIGTVHSVKGAEADHVVLLTDVSERVMASARVDADAELRVQYVAVTRARESLTLVQPSTRNFWTF